jgi:predicted ribosome quality control (RQC) complex YloA/Tae2 family protein
MPDAPLRPASSSLNWRELDLILGELDLVGCLIQEVHQPTRDALALSLFRAGSHFSVLLSLSPRFPRLHILSRKMPNPAKPLRFAAFMRAHVKGGRIESAQQVAGERIVRIEVRRAGEQRILWARLWGAAANAIVTDGEGTILDCFYRRPAKGEVSGGRFDPAAVVAASRPKKEYAIRELAGEGSFNQRIEAQFAETESGGDRERLAAQAEANLATRENKVLATLKSLEARLGEYSRPERFKELGDLITSNLHRIVRGGQLLEVEDFFHGDAPLAIELDPALSPAQNAESYYERSRKARLGRKKVEEEIASLHLMLEGIREQQASLAREPDNQSLEALARKAAEPRRPLATPDMPGLVFWSGSFRCIVGRSGSENDELLRRRVRGNDWWFHARDWPGAYVFVKAQPGKSLPLETMLDAGNLAMHFSKGKSSGGGDVYYTQVKYLRRAKGAKKGTVLPTQEKNLSIRLEPERIERLKQGSEDRG